MSPIFPSSKWSWVKAATRKTKLDYLSSWVSRLEDPVSTLEKMKEHLVAERGQQFACAGVRFTIGGIIDCFALVVVQWGGETFEISMLGLARFRHPRDPKTAANLLRRDADPDVDQTERRDFSSYRRC